MDKIACSLRNRFSLILFLVFSVFFIISGIPGVFRESVLYGPGYFLSFDFFKTFLAFIPFILCTLYVILLLRKKYVLVFSEKGILDKRFVLRKFFIPWRDVLSAEIKKKGKSRYYLYLKLKNPSKKQADLLKISLNNLDCDIMELNNFLIRIKAVF